MESNSVMLHAIIFHSTESHPSEPSPATEIRLVDTWDCIVIEVEEFDRRVSIPLQGDDLNNFLALLDAFCDGRGGKSGSISISSTPEISVRIASRGEPYARGIELSLPDAGMRRFVVGHEVFRMKDAIDAAFKFRDAAYQALEHAVFLARDRQIGSIKKLRGCLIEEGVEASVADRAILLWAHYTKSGQQAPQALS